MRKTIILTLLSSVMSFSFSTAAKAHSEPNRLEHFSYCSNGNCSLITGDFFHKVRDMPIDLHVTCKKSNHYALTFDDGPSYNYPHLLAILKRNNVKATFFVVGNNLKNEKGKAWFRQAFEDGHFMANHTFHHEDLTKLSAEEMIVTLENTRKAMMDAAFPNDDRHHSQSERERLQTSSQTMRPPFGNIDMNVDSVLKAHHYTSVRWNADRYDWNMPGDKPETTMTILERAQKQFDYIAQQKAIGKLFNESILDLNHDWQPTTVNAIQPLIDLVKAQGYEFVTMDVCLGT